MNVTEKVAREMARGWRPANIANRNQINAIDGQKLELTVCLRGPVGWWQTLHLGKKAENTMVPIAGRSLGATVRWVKSWCCCAHLLFSLSWLPHSIFPLGSSWRSTGQHYRACFILPLISSSPSARSEDCVLWRLLPSLPSLVPCLHVDLRAFCLGS